MPLYLPHGPLVNMASLDVTSLHSCPCFSQPTVLIGIENSAAVQHLHGEDQILNPELSSFPGKQKCNEEVAQL